MPDLQTRTYLQTRNAERRIADLEKSICRRGRWEIRAAGRAAATKPFDILSVTAQASPSTLSDIAIQPGTINQLLPTAALTAITYDFTAAGCYVKLKVTTDGKQVTLCSLAAEAGVTAAIGAASGGGPTSFDILIGIITQTKTIYQVWQGNISAVLARATTESKLSPTPGTSPYVFWYTWQLSQATT